MRTWNLDCALPPRQETHLTRNSIYDLRIAASAAWKIGRRRMGGRARHDGPVDIFLCIVDHFEPRHADAEQSVTRERLMDWIERYPEIAARHRDADGCPPAHTFCYPWDEYDEWEFIRLSELCAGGWGEIELQLHHQDDTSDSLRAKLRDAVSTYRGFGALTNWPDGRPAFGFVHGNWALDNSRIENGVNFCGVNDELTVLQEAGCYADFTFPAWQCDAQPPRTNDIYYAVDDPLQPRSADRGETATAGRPGTEGLLIVQGPLVPFIRRTKRGPRLGVDDGDLAGSIYRRYEPLRLDLWVRAGIHVSGSPDRVFIKLHCHGAADANREVLLGTDLDALFTDAEARYNDGARHRLHYVTAREMFNVIKATEANAAGEIPEMRDYVLAPPSNAPATALE
jgi:hypothetical protein